MTELTDNPLFDRPRLQRFVVSLDPGPHIKQPPHVLEEAIQKCVKRNLKELLSAHDLKVEVDELSTPPLGSTMKWRMGEWRWTIESAEEAA